MLKVQYFLILFFCISAYFILNPIRKQKVNRLVFRIIAVLLLLMVALRPSVMVDYEVYQAAFDGYRGFRFEPGFHLIRWGGEFLGNVQFWGFFIYALLCVSLKTKYIEKYPSFLWAALLVYLSSTIVTQDMIAMRAGVACSLFLFAVGFKLRNEKKKMYAALILAVLFHYSALACFVLPFLDNEKLHRKFYLFVLLLSHIFAIMGVFLNQYLSFLNYISALEAVVAMNNEGDEPMNFLNLVQLGHILICIVLWLNAKKMQTADGDSILYLKIYTIGLCVMPLLAMMMSMALRLQQLFLVVEILLLPIGFSALSKNKSLGKSLLIFYSALMFYFVMTDQVYWGIK